MSNKPNFSELIMSVMNDEKRYRLIPPVVKNGVTIRRAHYRNYMRPIKNGTSMRDRMEDALKSQNVLLAKLIKR